MAIIKCPKCGAMISSKAKQCPKCGYDMFGNNQNDVTPTDQPEVKENGFVAENPKGNSSKSYYKNPNDESSVFLNFLSLICPILGLLLFCFLKGTNKPHKANKCLEWAGIGFLTIFVISRCVF